MSDQDSFFDDEDAAPAKAPEPRRSAGPARRPAAKPVPKAVTSGAVERSGAPIFEQNVTLAVAALLMVIALLVGVIIGIFVGGAISTPAAGTSTTGSGTAAPTNSTGAAPLSQEQINSGLPEGHPNVGGAGAATGTTAP